MQEYLQAFSIALQNQEFACIYIDAFAGSGSRTEVRPGLPLFGPAFAEPEEITTPGSARIAIETPRCTQLSSLSKTRPGFQR
ncbi:hypothetical protein [Mesorhizobium sp. ES1-4]|uniref:hypothetical protein n=1 Tax=Mesorhizobium sp. ES1-4 TaxID=2876627 RepID=UPI0029623922|nr:hypothetical protein [Mesorhizobium sp. ES1-4]